MVLSTSLFYGYSQVMRLESSSDKTKKIVNERALAYQKLKDVLSTVHNDLNTAGSSLQFTYDNGVDKSPIFSSDVLGRLFVNDHEELCLETKPLPAKWPVETSLRTDILLCKVKECHFEFYFPKTSKKIVDPDQVEVQKELIFPYGYSQTWFSSYQRLPHSLKIFVTQEIDGVLGELIFPFVICNS